MSETLALGYANPESLLTVGYNLTEHYKKHIASKVVYLYHMFSL